MNNIENLERKKSLIKFTNRLREFLADEEEYKERNNAWIYKIYT